MAEQSVNPCKVSGVLESDKKLTTTEPLKQELQGGIHCEEEVAKKKQKIQQALEEALLAVGLESLVVSPESVEPCEQSEQPEKSGDGSEPVGESEELSESPMCTGMKKKGMYCSSCNLK